ncbi:hypothetical protein MTO96_021293 [Rhipicephalus appendiculatus]
MKRLPLPLSSVSGRRRADAWQRDEQEERQQAAPFDVRFLACQEERVPDRDRLAVRALPPLRGWVRLPLSDGRRRADRTRFLAQCVSRRESGGLTLGVCSLASGCAAMSSGRRIRPERSAGAQRRNVQKLTWRDSHWLQGFSDVDDQRGGPSASLSDMGGGAALRRVLLLCERQQHREAAALLSRLAPAAFRALVAELPVEVLLEQLPASLPPLEALYARAAFLEEPATALQALKPDALVLQMVRLFAQQHDADRDGASPWLGPPQMITSCKKLLKAGHLSRGTRRILIRASTLLLGYSARYEDPARYDRVKRLRLQKDQAYGVAVSESIDTGSGDAVEGQPSEAAR